MDNITKQYIKWLLQVFGALYFTLMGLLLQYNWFCAWLSSSKMCRVYINNFGEATPEYYVTLVCTALALVGVILIIQDLFNE